MDLRAFLPHEEVGKDDSWSVDLGSLGTIAMPGGNLRLAPEGVDVDEESMKMFEELFAGFGEDLEDVLEGECKCTYKGMQGEGDSLAEIEIEIEVATTLDMSGPLQKAIQKVIVEQGGDIPDISLDTADLNLDFDGSGSLLWDMKAGRMHAFHLTGDVTIGIDLEVGIEAEGERHEMSASLEMSGSLTEEVETKE